MPPLNKPEGQAWLWREIDAVKPDLIVFDSMMCLLVGPLSEEETWAPMFAADPATFIAPDRAGLAQPHRPRRQQGFGTKTKEWEFDTAR